MSGSVARRLAFASLFALCAAAYMAVGPAGAEQSGRAGVIASLDASIAPQELPRQRPVPVSLSLSGGIRTDRAPSPPQLNRIEIAFGARGGLETAGLPVCPRSRLRNTTTEQALSRCRGALVGRGQITTDVPLDPAKPLLARAGVLAFNGLARGRPAVWVQAYSASPPVSFVLPFYVTRLQTGPYGTLLRSPVRDALGRWPRLRGFEITLGRRYRADGERRSYLSARCPLPPRFDALSIPIARATYFFTPRPRLSITILRGCRVR
jgi:hypothetical protein